MDNAQILADSLNVETGDRLTTFLLPRFPKCLLAELGTHRMLSRNAASSRAIPVEKMIQRIEQDPYIPTWTINKKGMQGDLVSDDELKSIATERWENSLRKMISAATALTVTGIHKQNANRLLEPFMRVPVIVSGTEWENFFALRCDEATHPDFRSVAIEMRGLKEQNKPAELRPGEWHIPFSEALTTALHENLKIATARCARISYTSHDGNHSAEKDFELHDRLLASKHFSPFESCAMATHRAYPETNFYSAYGTMPINKPGGIVYTRNYRGFYQYRSMLEDGLTPA